MFHSVPAGLVTLLPKDTNGWMALRNNGICMHVCLHVHTYVHVIICVYICMCVPAYVGACVCGV